MQDVSNTLRAGLYLQQKGIGRSEQLAAMVVEAVFPFGHLAEGWPGRHHRKVKKRSRTVAKCCNPKRGWSEQQLLALLQETFGEYMAIAGAVAPTPQASVPYRSWRAYLAWACDPEVKIKDLLAGEGLQVSDP